MALGANRSRINVKGGGILQVREISPSSGSFASVGFIKDDNFFDEHTMVDSVDSKGDFIDTKTGARHMRWETSLMQTTKDEIDLLRNATAKYYEIYYKVVLNNTYVQEFVIPIARITPTVTMEFKSATERLLKIQIHALAPATALTRTPTAYNTSQWEPYALTENASAQGAPSDATTVPAAAI